MMLLLLLLFVPLSLERPQSLLLGHAPVTAIPAVSPELFCKTAATAATEAGASDVAALLPLLVPLLKVQQLRNAHGYNFRSYNWCRCGC